MKYYELCPACQEQTVFTVRGTNLLADDGPPDAVDAEFEEDDDADPSR